MSTSVIVLENMKEYIRFLQFVRPHVWVMIAAVLCMLVGSAMGGVSLGMIIPIVDNILAGKDILLPEDQNTPQFIISLVENINNLNKVTLLNWMILAIAFIFLLKEAALFFQTYFMNKLGQSIFRDVKNVIYKKLTELSADFYSNTQIGELVSRITFDVSIIINSVTEGLTDLLFQPIQLIVYLVILIGIKMYFSISWLLIAVILVIFPLVTYPVIRIGKKLRKISNTMQESMADIHSQLFETIYGIGIIKSFLGEEYQIKKFRDYNQRFFSMMMKSVKRMAGISPIGEFVGVLCMAIVLWMGGKDVVEGRLSAGAFIAFLAALLSLIKPFKRLSRLYGINLKAMAAISRVFKILNIEPSVKEKEGAVDFEGLKDTIEFRNVSFSYSSDKPVLEDITIRLKKGEVLAIVGLSGAGKSTLINLLPRFYDPRQGGVFIDGINIEDLKIPSLREQIGIVTQETILFNDTIKNNIAFGCPKAKEEDVIKAARAANAHDFIIKMPEGYDSFIGDRGLKLSGGEKQRIAIARALFKDPPILILDEATSQLDTESERLVQEAIDRLMEHRTVLVIAHRLSTIEHADNIVVLENGRMIESGNHKELIEASGTYRRLYELQFTNLEDLSK